jgi:hypothetical protein
MQQPWLQQQLLPRPLKVAVMMLMFYSPNAFLSAIIACCQSANDACVLPCFCCRTPVAAKDWGCFSSRLQQHLPLLQQLGYKYRPVS